MRKYLDRGEICLFVNLATVLNKKTWIVLVIIYEFADMLGLYLDILFFHAILKTSKLVFLHLRSRFRVSFFFFERMGITVVPWRSTFFS